MKLHNKPGARWRIKSVAAMAGRVHLRQALASETAAKIDNWIASPGTTGDDEQRPLAYCFELRRGDAYEVEVVDYHRG